MPRERNITARRASCHHDTQDAVRRQMVEECARLCDGIAAPEPDDDPYDRCEIAYQAGAKRCAQAIRALALPASEKGGQS